MLYQRAATSLPSLLLDGVVLFYISRVFLNTHTHTALLPLFAAATAPQCGRGRNPLTITSANVKRSPISVWRFIKTLWHFSDRQAVLVYGQTKRRIQTSGYSDISAIVTYIYTSSQNSYRYSRDLLYGPSYIFAAEYFFFLFGGGQVWLTWVWNGAKIFAKKKKKSRKKNNYQNKAQESQRFCLGLSHLRKTADAESRTNRRRQTVRADVETRNIPKLTTPRRNARQTNNKQRQA